MEIAEWRKQLQPYSREQIIEKIMDTFTKHLPSCGPEGLHEIKKVADMYEDITCNDDTSQPSFSGPEGFHEIKKLAERYEEKFHTAARSEWDYLLKVSQMVRKVETECQNTMPNQVSNTNRSPDQDWRTHLQPVVRQQIVNKMMDTIKKHLVPFSGPEDLHEIKENSERYEEKIYTAARSEWDYLLTVSKKLRMAETGFQNTLPNQVRNSNRPPEQDWRTCLQPLARQQIVNKMINTLKKHLPSCGPEVLHEIKKLAERSEEKLYTAARSEWDYLLKVSHKVCKVEAEFQNRMPNQVGNRCRPPGQASLDSTTQTVHANGGDWQEVVYQKIKLMEAQYLAELNEAFLKNTIILLEIDRPDLPKSEQLIDVIALGYVIEQAIMFLEVTKAGIQPWHKVNLASFEKQIIDCLNLFNAKEVRLLNPSSSASVVNSVAFDAISSDAICEHA